MDIAEQQALLRLWNDYLDGREASSALMRDFYREAVPASGHYRYGMAPELFDLLVNGVFDPARARLWNGHVRRTDPRAA